MMRQGPLNLVTMVGVLMVVIAIGLGIVQADWTAAVREVAEKAGFDV